MDVVFNNQIPTGLQHYVAAGMLLPVHQLSIVYSAYTFQKMIYVMQILSMWQYI